MRPRLDGLIGRSKMTESTGILNGTSGMVISNWVQFHRLHFQSLLKHLFSSFLSKSKLKRRKPFLQVIHSAGKYPEKLYSLDWHLSLSICITCYNILHQIFEGGGKLIIK